MSKKLSFAKALAGQLVGHHIGPQTPDAYDKPTNIVTARNGVFRVVRTPVAIFKTQIAKMEKDQVVPGADVMEAGVELTIPKIPFKYWLQALQWYKDVHTKDFTEASLLFFWNHDNVDLPTHYTGTKEGEQGPEVKGLTQDGQLIIYCPIQKNSGGLSQFEGDGMVNWLREHTTPLLETHSHHTMDAYFSGTDNANENMTQFYGVYGKIKDKQPKFAFRFVSGDQKIECDPSILFDFPQIEVKTTIEENFIGLDDIGIPMEGTTETITEYENYMGPWPDKIPYPEDWMGQHSKSYTYPSYNKGKNQSGNYPNYASGYPYGGYPGYEDEYYDEYYGNSYAKNASKKKDQVEDEDAEIITTDSATVQVTADYLIDHLSIHDIKQLILELSDYGYDYIIAEALKELKETK